MEIFNTAQVPIKSEIPEYIEKPVTEMVPQGQVIDNLLVKEESDADYNLENYEITSADLEREFEAFHKEDEKKNSGKTVLENNTTAYKCQMCSEIFTKFPEYKLHKKQHYIDKRTCKLCNVIFQGLSKLEDHMNVHLGIKPHKCDECGKGFVSKHHVKLHKRSHIKDRSFKCTECSKCFKNQGCLRSHMIVHSRKIQEFVCKICSTDCKVLPDFRKHMEEHGKVSEIKCGVCSKTFTTDRSLEIHLNSHKELKFPCEYCGKIYPSMYRIKRHIRRAHVPNQCDLCQEVFYDRALFTKHKKQHEESAKSLTCTICNKTFDKAKNLSEHIRLQHKQDGQTHACPVCQKEFINRALLNNHVKTHDKCFKCSYCDKVFASRYNLETHSVTHTGEKNYICDICGKCYATKTTLKNHKGTHTDVRSFQCEQCQKTFKTNRRLYVHKISHTTDYKFQCEICMAKFKTRDYLKCHSKRHSTVKPFQCDVCKKRFKHKKSYEKHMKFGKHRKFDGTEEHDCDFCDDSFATRDLLLEHFNEEHYEENLINEIEMEENKDEIKVERFGDGMDDDGDNDGEVEIVPVKNEVEKTD